MVRHAQQDYPSGDGFDFEEWEDPPLSGLGRTQAMALAAELGEQDVDAVYCSTMRRAVETAQIVASPHGITPVIRENLVELQSYSKLEKGQDPMALVDPDEWATREEMFFKQVKWDYMFFGEGSEPFRRRAVAAVTAVVEENIGKHVVLVSHGGVINAYLADILGIQEDMFFLPNHCSITSVWVKGDVRRVHSVNERMHLHAGLHTN